MWDAIVLFRVLNMLIMRKEIAKFFTLIFYSILFYSRLVSQLLVFNDQVSAVFKNFSRLQMDDIMKRQYL